MGVSAWMFLLVLAHSGCPRQNRKSHKTVVCVSYVMVKPIVWCGVARYYQPQLHQYRYQHLTPERLRCKGDGYNADLQTVQTVNGKLALTICLCLEQTLTLIVILSLILTLTCWQSTGPHCTDGQSQVNTYHYTTRTNSVGVGDGKLWVKCWGNHCW